MLSRIAPLAFVLMCNPALAQQEMSETPVPELTRKEVRTMDDADRQARVDVLEARIEELQNTDPSELTSSERRDVRKELRQMSRELEAHAAGGIYISAGAIIVILLLIIIF